MATYYKMGQMTGNLTTSDSTVALVQIGGAVVTTSMAGLLRGVSMMGTAGSPDGLFSVSFYADASGQEFLGNGRIADMGSKDSDIIALDLPMPFTAGLYFSVLGDGDSDGTGYAFTPVVEYMR